MLGYRQLRAAYQMGLNRDGWALRQGRRNAFSSFVQRGSLVFDIGACHGELTDVFASLGCRVVSVEPNPAQAELIRKRYAGRRVTVEQVAVGEKAGEAQLAVGKDPGHSTLSTAWLERAPTRARWNGAITVPVTTLHDLALKYGQPAFVKIDVEAYEPQVLRGASKLPPSLCFEFQNATFDITENAISVLNGYRFVHTLGESPLPVVDWLGAPGIVKVLRELAARDPAGYGDVFARR